LNADVQISEEKAQDLTAFIVTSVNAFVKELRRLVFVQDFLDSLKFLLLLWLLTYVGAKVDGLGLLTIGEFLSVGIIEKKIAPKFLEHTYFISWDSNLRTFNLIIFITFDCLNLLRIFIKDFF
jgi:hypothetical protein